MRAMRGGQYVRRLLYLGFGVVPAFFALYLTGGAVMFVHFAWMATGAVVGTAGLVAATIARRPPGSRALSVSIAIALLAGIMTMLPWSLIIVWIFVEDLTNGRTAAEVSTMQGAGDFVWRTAVAFWWMAGPVVVAVHFLISLKRRRDAQPPLEKA